MNTIEKATEYIKSQKEDNLNPSWLDVREAYIAGAKDSGQIEYNADEYLPPAASEPYSVEVLDIDTGQVICYNYLKEEWLTIHDDIITVQRWKFGEPVKVGNSEPTDPKYKLWKHIADEHDIELLDGQLWDIIHLVRELDGNEPDKTAHQLEQELKQLQYEKREMEKQIKETNEKFTNQ